MGIDNVDDLDFLSLIQILREKLDPLEWGMDSWPYKILLAEKWLSVEALVKSPTGLRGPGKKTLGLLDQIKKLAVDGMIASEIGRMLQVSPSKISLMRRSFPELEILFVDRHLGGRPRGNH